MSQRRGPGEASVYREGNGWRGSASLGRKADGSRHRVKVRGATKAEVLRKIRDLQQGVDRGLPVPDGRITVGGFLERWVTTTLPGSVSSSTRDDYEDTIRLHLKPTLGPRLLAKLTIAEVDALWQDKRAKGYSPNSIRIMRAVLRKAIGQAEREGLVARNVAALSAPPRIETSLGRSFTAAEARRFLEAASKHRLGTCFLITLVYGLRRGEVLGLRWSDLDETTARLLVRRSVKRVKARDGSAKTVLEVSALKTRRSRRSLHLTEELVEELRAHREAQAREKCALGAPWHDHDLMFASEAGTLIDPDNLSHYFTRLCQDAGLGHWHIHELRHSGASLMLAQGVPLHVVSEVLGHSSIVMTKDVYGHLVEGEQRSAAAAMSRLLRNAERDG